MEDRETYWGDAPVRRSDDVVVGHYSGKDDAEVYEIRGFDRMDPFLVTLASPTDHWIYASSRGGLSCGRKSPDHALFPYYTDDKIHDAADTTGPYTAIIVADRGRSLLWRPFLDRVPSVYELSRLLSKDETGSCLRYTESNATLDLEFSYSWELSERFGFVRTATLRNLGESRTISILDGIRNVLPAGIDRVAQERVSTLLDGYKQCELDSPTGMGMYSLGSILTDRAEPSEALRATTVYRVGLSDAKVLLSEEQVAAFAEGVDPIEEHYVRGRRGAYLLAATIELEASRSERWIIAAEVEQDSCAVANTRSALLNGLIERDIREDIARGREELRRLVASADGSQLTADRPTVQRHFSNVLFNIMRGGVYIDGYRIDVRDLAQFVQARNRDVHSRSVSFLQSLPLTMHIDDLVAAAEAHGDLDLKRLILEYLPLIFSRRHGDPSRPWNKFSIDLRDSEGRPRITYQGNWRDIFQNWEALSLSFPRFLNSIIARFLNASTADGYNPYRIFHEGFEWEVLDPDDPWSNIGYWGDHQIVYLHRLLESSYRHDPTELRKLLSQRLFSFADVPYRIARFAEIVVDPYNTVSYDEIRAAAAAERVEQLGSDGKLVFRDGSPYRVSMLEKLLVTTLTKLSNFIPGGGVWMNTQRPEWNDANNALAGWGLSMVTTAYLRRFIAFLLELLSEDAGDVSDATEISDSVVRFFKEIEELVTRFGKTGSQPDDEGRWAFLAAAGAAGERYREEMYDGRFGAGTRSISGARFRRFLQGVRDLLDETLRANRRDDGLYHSYNVLELRGQSASIIRLDEMLEGQVAILSSGVLNSRESLDLLMALRKSRLYREDQNSYTLYPDRILPSFLENNVISPEAVERISALGRVAQIPGQAVLGVDVDGVWHFDGDLRNVEVLRGRLEDMDLDASDREDLVSLYEDLFGHRRFTGRSGSFFKYEGLGSIYWHMVSKLRLVIAELIEAGGEADGGGGGTDEGLTGRLREIREGIGVHKSPAEYGAFPTDPYSHTPGFTGVQQPGMTGQVKEDIISRFTELGVSIVAGRVCIKPVALDAAEFLSAPGVFSFYDVDNTPQSITINPGELAFTYCNVPVIYRIGERFAAIAALAEKDVPFEPAACLSRELSREVFARTGVVERIEVSVKM